jgi:hypothetical protein
VGWRSANELAECGFVLKEAQVICGCGADSELVSLELRGCLEVPNLLVPLAFDTRSTI